MVEFGQLLFLGREEGYLSMLGAFVDDSGAEDSHTYVLSAFFTTPKEWDSIMRKWTGIVRHYGVQSFHATDCANGAEEFGGWSNERKRGMFTKLINILTHHSNLRACGAGILCKDYEEVVYPEAHKLFGGPRLLVFQLLLLDVAKLADAPVAFIMDKPSKGWGDIDGIFDRTKKESTVKWRNYLHTLTPADARSVPAIQTADLLAYETYRHLSQKSGAVRKRRVRKSLWRLVMEKSLLRGHYLERKGLQRLIEQCKATGKLTP